MKNVNGHLLLDDGRMTDNSHDLSSPGELEAQMS